MNLTIFDSVGQSLPVTQPINPSSLYCTLEQVPDGRKRRGKRYPFALILTLLLLLGKLAGETTIKGVVEWVELREIALRKQLDWPRRFPSTATYTRALAGCDAEALARLLAQAILKAHTQEKPPQASASQTLTQVAIDGKTLRGTLGHRHAHQPAVHVLSCYEPQTGLVVAHRAVPHTNAMKSARWLSG